MAEHPKLGSSPSSQSLQQADMLYFTFFCLLYTHTYITQMHVLCGYERVITRNIKWCLLVEDLGCNAHRKKKKNWKENERMSSSKWMLCGIEMIFGSHCRWSTIICSLWGFGVWAMLSTRGEEERKEMKKLHSTKWVWVLRRMYLLNVIYLFCTFMDDALCQSMSSRFIAERPFYYLFAWVICSTCCVYIRHFVL